MTISEELREYIVKRHFKEESPDGFNQSSDLIGSGILTSLSLVDLLGHIERQYAIKIGDADLAPEHFETIAALERLIEARR